MLKDALPTFTEPPDQRRPAPRHADARVQKLIHFFEHLQLSDLAQLHRLYTPEAYFKDPFHSVQGVGDIDAIFRRMFTNLQAPRFTVHSVIAEGAQCFMTWDFDALRNGLPLHIHGSSHLLFDLQGRVALHRDYWDAAEELYEQLPLLGGLLRWLKRRIAGPAAQLSRD
jgi:steroid delta-isomerase